jgi:large-conductance mechanosensitive channel MscL
MEGFKQFLLRGNVVDMAVGIVVGAAFGTVVTSFKRSAHAANRSYRSRARFLANNVRTER